MLLEHYCRDHWFELFGLSLQRALSNDPADYLNFVRHVLTPLVESPAALEGVIADGVVDVLLEYAIAHAGPVLPAPAGGPASGAGATGVPNSDEVRSAAYSLLAQLWQLLPAELSTRPDSARAVIDLLRSGCRFNTGSRSIQLTCLTALFGLLDSLIASNSEYASVVYKALIFALIENHSNTMSGANGSGSGGSGSGGDDNQLHDFMIHNLTLSLKRNPRLPVSVLIEPLVKQHSLHGYESALDFDFLIVLSRHPRLAIRQALLLVHLLGKVALSGTAAIGSSNSSDDQNKQTSFARLAVVPFLILIDRFHSEKSLIEYVEKYVKVCLSVVMKAGAGLTEVAKTSGHHHQNNKASAAAAAEYDRKQRIAIEVISKIAKLRYRSLSSRIQPLVTAAKHEYNANYGSGVAGSGGSGAGSGGSGGGGGADDASGEGLEPLNKLEFYLSTEPMIADGDSANNKQKFKDVCVVVSIPLSAVLHFVESHLLWCVVLSVCVVVPR